MEISEKEIKSNKIIRYLECMNVVLENQINSKDYASVINNINKIKKLYKKTDKLFLNDSLSKWLDKTKVKFRELEKITKNR